MGKGEMNNGNNYIFTFFDYCEHYLIHFMFYDLYILQSYLVYKRL